MRAVLGNLGIANGMAGGHETHFHIDLKPPTLQEIRGGGQHLLTEREFKNLVSPTSGENTMMSNFDALPSDSLLIPPALIANANVKMRDWGNVKLSDEPGFRKVITSCLDVRGYENINPEGDVLTFLGYSFEAKSGKYIPVLDPISDVKIQVIQRPKHGIVGSGVQGDASSYGYLITERNPDNTPSYFGPDRVVFQVEVKGQKFKVILNLLSIPDAETPSGQLCESRRFGLADMTSGDLAAWQRSADLSAPQKMGSGLSLTHVTKI